MKLTLIAALGVSFASGTLLLSLSSKELGKDTGDPALVTGAGQTAPDSEPLALPESEAIRVSAQAAGFSTVPTGYEGAWAGKHPADDAASW